MSDEAETNPVVPRTALLADGSVTRIRPLAPEDAPALRALNERLSERSFYLRYFTLGRRAADDYVAHLLTSDQGHLALVAELHGEIVAVGSYEQLRDPSRAEVAFVVADAHHAKGLGTLLLEHLAAVAETRGITHFVASALAENRQMLDVFSRSGYDVVPRHEREVVEIEFPVTVTERLLDAVAERERLAGARSVRRLFCPQTVAVVGAGRREGNVGNAAVRNLAAAGFTGRVVPVNPNAETVRGLQAYPRISDVPGTVDLAVIAVPAQHVVDVVRECAACGVADVVVLSSGFAEAGAEGRAREAALVEACRDGGMRLVGPNCIGIANTDPAVRLDATFAPVTPRRGPIGMMTQSGAVGIVALRRTVAQHLGVSTFASVGNKADVSGNDLLMYWEDDPATRVVALYLESFGNPQKFARIARRVSRRKPIVALVSGRSAAGARAARSHTARTVTSAVAVDALLAQTGVIGAGSLEELLHITALLAHQPPPEGRCMAIVGNSGGPGVLAADACGVEGLAVDELGPAARRTLEQLPGIAATANPVDLGAAASPAALEQAVRAVLADPGVDAVIVVWAPVFEAGPEALVQALGAALSGVEDPKPVVAVQLADEAAPAPLDVGQGVVIPAFAYPEHAARALRRAADYGRWRRQAPAEGFQPADVDRDAARGLAGQVLHARPEGGWLDAHTAAELLRCYGIEPAAAAVVDSAQAAQRAAEQLGCPVALKVADPQVVHKSDVGGVRLDLADASALHQAYQAMVAVLPQARDGVVVQRMAPRGVEMIVGVVRDRLFGPVVMVGLGGTATELLADRSVRVPPLEPSDAAEMIAALRSAPLLHGYRGAQPCDVAALERLVLRVGRLAEDIPEVAELDLNPVMALPKGAVVADVKIRLEPAPRRLSPLLREL